MKLISKVLIGVLVFVIVIIGGVYLYQKSQDKTNNNFPIITDTMRKGDNKIEQLNKIDSPDGKMSAYLEKEFDASINRYVRQSVIMLDKKTQTAKVLHEVNLTQAEALVRYTEDGWDKLHISQCTSLINFTEYKPIRWIDNDTIEVEQYIDNYECAGVDTYILKFNTKGQMISERHKLLDENEN